MTIRWCGADADDLHLAHMTLNRFAEVTFAVRRQAQGGDASMRRVADALESVLRLRISAAIARQKMQPEQKTSWWQRCAVLVPRCGYRSAAQVRMAFEQKNLPVWGAE